MKDPRIKDFVSAYQAPKQTEPFFGFFRVSEKGINGTGNYYRNKIIANSKEKREERKKLAILSISERFDKFYQKTMGINKLKKNIKNKQ